MSDFSFKAGPEEGHVFVRLYGIQEATRRAIRQSWFTVGKDLQAEANHEILKGRKTGRLYSVKGSRGRSRRHRASAPGETHANLSGRLRRSISWKVHGTDSMDFGYGVSTTQSNAAPDYASFVEFGTSRMDARPSLKNAINATQRSTEQALAGAAAREFGGRE